MHENVRLQVAERLLAGPGRGWVSRVFFTDNDSTAAEVAVKMGFGCVRRFVMNRLSRRRSVVTLTSPCSARAVLLFITLHPRKAVIGVLIGVEVLQTLQQTLRVENTFNTAFIFTTKYATYQRRGRVHLAYSLHTRTRLVLPWPGSFLVRSALPR